MWGLGLLTVLSQRHLEIALDRPLSFTNRSMYVKRHVKKRVKIVQFSHSFHAFFTHFSHEFHTHISHVCEILHSEIYVKRA